MAEPSSPHSPRDAAAVPRRRLGDRLGGAVRSRFAASGFDQLHLRWRFRLVVLVFGMPFLAYIVYAATQQAALEKARVSAQARASATLLSARFEDHIEQTVRLLGTASQSIATRLDDVPATNALVQSMRSYLPKSVDNVAVWGIDGHNIAALDRRSATRNVNVADRRYFIEAVKRRDLAFEGPTVSRSTGAEIIQFAHPLIDAHNAVIGVMTISMRTAELVSLLDPSGAIGGGDAVITIFNEEGRIVARSVDTTFWVGQQVPNAAQLHVAFARKSGASEQPGIDGRMRLIGYSVVPQWPWIVMVGEPIEKVTGPVGRRLLEDLAIGLAIFAIAFFVADRLAARTLVPLMQLAADTDRLADGDLSYRSDVSTGGEIAVVAANFNRMAAAIEEREIALTASRQQLRAVTDNIPALICYIDRDERYRFVNDYRGVIPGRPREELVGMTVREVRGEALYGVLGPRLSRALAGEPSGVEASRVYDGRTYHFHHAYVPDRAEDGTIRGVYAFVQDITERKTAELARAESEKRLVTISENLPAMICYVDTERCFRFVNRACEKWLKRSRDEIVGKPFDQLLPPKLAAQYNYQFLRGMQGETVEYEFEIPLSDGSMRWLRCNFVPDVDGTTGAVLGVYGMMHDVTRAKQAEQRLTRLAQFDTLTGLANRHSFNETLAQVMTAARGDDAPLALMFLDIDHFKQVNDRCGHACGDILLKEFAQRLSDSVRPTDTVARLSGDEFVVLLDGLHSDDEPQFIARKIVAAIEKPFLLDGEVLRVTTSIGIAMRSQRDEPASTLMKRADDALYEAKGAGRNTYRLAS